MRKIQLDFTGKFVIAGLALTISSCATGPYPVESPFYQIPAGSHIELNQPLTIPPNKARVYLQYGKVVSEKEKDRYQSHCWFLSWKVLEQSQLVKPDSFTVLRTQKNEDVVKRFSNVRLASNSIRLEPELAANGIRKMDLYGGDAPMAIEYTTQLFIQSEKQPDIRLLECSHWDDPSSGEHLTLEQMQQALGNIARIIIGSPMVRN